MKVSELIEQLQKLPQDADVIVVTDDEVKEVFEAHQFFDQKDRVEIDWLC